MGGQYVFCPARVARLVVLITVFLLLAGLMSQPVLGADAYVLSQNMLAYASSVDGGNIPAHAVDGDPGTKWGSEWGVDPQWLYVDLGTTASIEGFNILWENAYAVAYELQVSNDELNWTTIYSTTSGDGGSDHIMLPSPVTGRYVRVYCIERYLTSYGYAIHEFEVIGTGGLYPPPSSVPNIALHKPVTVSSVQYADYLPPGSTEGVNAVDGDTDTRWGSEFSDPQWIQVDLGQNYNIGRVVLRWESAYGRAYDLQVSNDGQNWRTVYRELHGGGGVDDIPLYTSGRYVRMYGIARGTGFGYSLYELEVYEYVSEDPQPSYVIEPITVPETVPVGSGSYRVNDLTMMQPRNPKYRTDNVTPPSMIFIFLLKSHLFTIFHLLEMSPYG